MPGTGRVHETKFACERLGGASGYQAVYQALILVLAGIILYAFLNARRERLGQIPEPADNPSGDTAALVASAALSSTVHPTAGPGSGRPARCDRDVDPAAARNASCYRSYERFAWPPRPVPLLAESLKRRPAPIGDRPVVPGGLAAPHIGCGGSSGIGGGCSSPNAASAADMAP
jgi:hypothetical protein